MKFPRPYQWMPPFVLLAFFAIGLILILLNACNGPRSLPHRPVNALTNWGQGRAPTPGQCPPGTVEIEIDGLFLECLRGTN